MTKKGVEMLATMVSMATEDRHVLVRGVRTQQFLCDVKISSLSQTLPSPQVLSGCPRKR